MSTHLWKLAASASTSDTAMTCPWGNQPLDHDQMRSLISYYDSTWFDYRWLWLNNENHAIHFGYQDIYRSSHAESLVNTNRVLAEIAAVLGGAGIFRWVIFLFCAGWALPNMCPIRSSGSSSKRVGVSRQPVRQNRVSH